MQNNNSNSTVDVRNHTYEDFQKITNFLNITKNNLIFLEILEDTTKSLKFYLLSNLKQICIFKIENSETLLFSEKLIFNCDINDESIFAYSVFLNRIFIINSINSVYLVDFDRKELFSIELEEEEALEICQKHSYVFLDTKIIFTGGINKANKINKNLLSFDISLYKFSEEKVRENNLIPRYRHGSIVISDVIYVIGGFTTLDESNEKICQKIQAIKYDNLMNTWLEVKVEGDQPCLLIDPKISFNSDNLMVYSDYLYPKIFCLKNSSSNGKMINLNTITFNKTIPLRSVFSRKLKNSLDEASEECEILFLGENLLLNKMNFVILIN